MMQKKHRLLAVMLSLAMVLGLAPVNAGALEAKSATAASAPITYIVTFNMNGHGTAIEAVTVNSGEKVTRPADPTATDYTFGGWYKEQACVNQWDFDADTVTATTILYAKWTAETQGGHEQFVALGNRDGSGIILNTGTPYYVNGNDSATGTKPESWNAYFDAANETLYLNELQISGYYRFFATYPYTAAIYSNGDLTISLIGESTVKNTAPDLGNAATYYGLNLWKKAGSGSSTNHSLIVTSENQGVLNVSGPNSVGQNNAGITVSSLTIQGNAVVNATGGESTNSYSSGVSASKNITVSGNAQLIASSSDAPNYISQGIAASSTLENTLTVTDNAYVKASSGISKVNVNCGVYISILRMSGNGKLEACGNTTGNMSCGVYARAGVVEISDNASLYAKGGNVTGKLNAYNGSYGIANVAPPAMGSFFDGTLVMAGGTLTAVGEQGAIISQKPIDLENYDDMYTAQGSAQADGSNLVDYDSATPKAYLYVSVRPKIAAPTASPNGGSFSSSQVVELSCDTEGAEIYYTIDGTEPTTGSTKYEEPFTITTTATVKAIAVKSGNSSEVLTITFIRYTGGGSYKPTYSITVEEVENGSVKVSHTRAQRGDTVNITAAPDDGYELDKLTVLDKDGDTVKLTGKVDGKYAFQMPSGKVTIEVTFRPIQEPEQPWENPFTDVDNGAWYASAVEYVLENGLMNGTSPTTFEPDATTSRGMIVTILYRLAGSPNIEDEIWGYPYADVDATAYYGTAVYWARLNGIASGYSDEQFGPNDAITREQLAAMLYRFAKAQGYDVTARTDLNGYTDFPQVSGYALEAMRWAVDSGVITGTSGTTLTPQGQATRAQTAAMLTRFAEAQQGKTSY